MSGEDFIIQPKDMDSHGEGPSTITLITLYNLPPTCPFLSACFGPSMQVTYDDGDAREELLPLKRVCLSKADLPAPDVLQLEALGAFLLLKAEEVEKRDLSAAGGTERSRSIKGSLGQGEEGMLRSF